MAIQASNLVRAVELWVPSEDGDVLTLASGAYGDLSAFGEVSKGYRFAKGDGLPGLCWQTGSPLILHSLFTSDFQRAEEGRKAGLTSGIGIPAVCAGEVTGVLVMLCDDGEGAQGAFEVWQRTDRDELGMHSNYYANLERFGTVSSFVRFPRGSGLPGEVWQDRFPKIIRGLGSSPTFMRGAGAAADGLDIGVGLPIMRSEHDLDSVLLMLSSKTTPIAQVVEIWTTNEEETQMQLHSGFYGTADSFRDASRDHYFCPGEDLVGKVWASKRPMLSDDLAKMESARGEATTQSGLSVGIGFPVFVGRHLRTIFTMYF